MVKDIWYLPYMYLYKVKPSHLKVNHRRMPTVHYATFLLMFLSPGTMRNQQWVSDDETQFDIDFFQDIQGFGIHEKYT